MDDEVLLVRTQPKRVLQQNVAKKYVLKKVDQWGFEKTWLNKEIGYGVKTQKKFIKGDFLLEYRGVLRLKADMIDIERHYDEIGAGSFVFDFKHNEISYCLDATEDNGSLCRFVNDSKLNPNAVMKKIEIDGVPRLCLFALRDISFGEEIRYSYGVALPWHHQEKMQRLFLNLYLNCSIGSERKELSDLDKTIEKNGCLYLKSEENEKKMTNWIPKIVGKVMKNGRENGYILEHQPNTMAADNEKMRTHITMKDVSSYTSLMAAINSGGKGKALLTIQFSPILRTDQWLTDYTNNLVDQLIDIPVLHPITKPGRQKQDTWVYPDGKGRVRIFKVIDGKYVEVDEVEAGLTSLCHDFSRGLNFAEKLDGTFKDLVPLVENNSHGSSFPCIIQVYSAALMALHYETIYKKFSGCPMPLVIGRSGTAKTTHTRIAARTIGINGSMYRPTKAVLERRVAAHLPLWWEDVENRNVLEAMVFMIFNHSEVPNCDKDEDPPAPPNTMPIGTTNGKFLKNFRAEDWPRFEERIVFIPIMEKVESQLSLIEIMKNDETFDQLRIVASRCFLDCLSLVEELEKDHFYTDAHLVATDKLFSTIDFFESVRSKKNYGILLYITSKILSKAGFSQERITEINKTFLINHLKPFLEKRVVDENDTDIVREEASLKKFFIRAMENPKTSLFVTDNEKAAETCKDCISFALQPINTELKFFKPDQLSSIRQIIVENGCGLTKRRMIGGPKNTQINCMHIKVAFMKEEFTSFFAGVSFVSHELLLAILTILFFYHNQNIRGKKHTCNSRIIPIFSPSWDEKREIPNIPDPYTADQQTTIDSKTKEMVVEVLIGVRKTRDIVSTIKEMCLHRAFVEQDVLRKPSPRDCLDDDEVAHKTILEYNLNAFGLVVFETARDGDCCFRSILHQLHNVFQLDDNKELENYLTGLSLGQSIEDDISTLRLLFVENLKNDVNYRNFLVNTEYDDVDDYKNRGVFSSNTGDFVVKVLSDVLRIPIMIIQSNDRLSVETFIPSVLLYQKPLVIALNIWEQHYSSTEPLQDKKDPRDEESEEKEDEQKNEDEPAICHCMNGCFRKDGVKSCPCIKANRNCSAKCRCRKCSNNKAVKQRLKGCRCQTSCRDTDGRNTKCPCFKNRLGCDMCNCKSCENPYGKNENRKKNSGKVGGKRKRQPYTAYKKKRSEIFLASKSMKLPEGCWSLDETACIYTCTEMVLAELNQICMKSIFKIYDYIYRNRASYPEVKLREKNVKQIKAKLQYMGFNI